MGRQRKEMMTENHGNYVYTHAHTCASVTGSLLSALPIKVLAVHNPMRKVSESRSVVSDSL